MDTLKQIARAAMLEHNLRPEFSASVHNELKGIGTNAGRAQVADLTQLPWCSIDNDDSRDLDQLTVAETTKGRSRVLIAIADVDAFVEHGSAIDAHAHHNTTSVYTAAQVFPMLPERLSTDLTSLNPQEERLAIVMDMTVDDGGDLVASDVYRARVHSKAKLAYDSVAAWLDNDAPAPEPLAQVPELAEQLRLQQSIAERLRRKRLDQGSLNLESSQTRPVFRDEALTDLRADQENTAKELIETFMVAANSVVANFLATQRRPALRRVLRSPERWPRIVALASEHGAQLPATPDSVALSSFLESQRQRDPEGFAELSLSIIKLLGAGRYEVALPDVAVDGHFGLAVSLYTHATAPNRRLPDLITQRLLKAALVDAPSPYSEAELREIADHCNEQQRNAAKVERTVRKAATAFLLTDKIGQRFRAVVTGASAKGTWVRIEHPLAEGKLIDGFEGRDVGDRLTVELIAVDPSRGFIDFAARR